MAPKVDREAGAEGPTANVDQVAYWNGEAAQHWLAYEQRYDEMLRPFTTLLVEAACPAASEVVLDVGCGCGATTLAAGRLVAEGGAWGVDISEPLLQRARLRAAEENLTCVRFEWADAQSHPFEEASFDVAVSRFGLMFFDDPVAGLANVRRALRPGGRLAFVCWQSLLSNEWVTVPGAVLMSHVGAPDLGPPGGPGPFALADKERLLALLTDAGFADLVIEPVCEPLVVGREPEETAEFMMKAGPGRRMLEGADPATVARAADGLAEELGGRPSATGIWLGSAAWLVVARR